jgi:predicted amidohydrolase YtcJ
MDRRSFLKAAGLASLATPTAFAQPRRAADVIFVNARITTMESAQPSAEALAVRAGRILAIGSREQIEALTDRGTRVIDLGGRGVSPGLIDAHTHLSAFGHMELRFVKLRPPAIHNFDTLRGALAEAARATPKGEWIVGRGFADFDEGRFPRRQEIDDAAPDNPALLIQWTGQYGIANTRALEAAGLLRADVADPYGGKYLRDPRSGIPNGFLLHYPAIYSVYMPKQTESQELDSARWGSQRFVELGVTCVHDNFANLQSTRAYVQLERNGELPLRLRVYPYVANLEQAQIAVKQVKRYSGPLVRIQGVKLAVDGYPLMYKVPSDRTQVAIPMHPQDKFDAIISTIHRADLQVDVHAAGDRGVDWTLDGFSKAAGSDQGVRERRHRIEHYMFYKADSIARTGEMGVPVCTQPAWIPIRAAELTRLLGPEPVERMIPVASFRQAGVHICFGADVPASPTDLPLDSIRGAMLRRTSEGQELYPAERVSFMEALAAHTIESAYAAFDEGDLGSLAPGKCADLTVWNMDLADVTEDNVGSLEAVATYVGGQSVWEQA